MKLLRNGFLLIGLIVLVLAGVVVFRTLALKAPAETADASAITSPSIDADAAAQHLSAAVKFQTVSHADKADDHPEILQAQQAWLATTYPHFHSIAPRETVGDAGLIWTWQGSDPSLAPIILMAHQDVVPVSDDTRGEWKADPFGGEIKDGAVWGRGSIDDKGSLISLMEAGEALDRPGVQAQTDHTDRLWPRRRGARIGRAWRRRTALKARGVHALYRPRRRLGHRGGLSPHPRPGGADRHIRKGLRHPSRHRPRPRRAFLRPAEGHRRDHPVGRLWSPSPGIRFPLEVKGPTAGMLDALGPAPSLRHAHGDRQPLAVQRRVDLADGIDPRGHVHAAHHHRPDHAAGLAQG